MPIDNQLQKDAHQISRHDPSALVDLHPAPPLKDVPETLPLPLKLISVLCPPRRRKDPQRHPPSPAVLPLPSPGSDPILAPSFAHSSTYTSFPPPTFHHNGQPRALDSRLYPDPTNPQAVAAQRRKHWREQLAAEKARRKKDEAEEHQHLPEERERKRKKDRRRNKTVKSNAPELNTPILSCPHQTHRKHSSPLHTSSR